MNSVVLLSFVIAYFVILLVVAYFTSRNSNNESFFIGNKNSNWMLVAFGMIGTSLSGVTFVSVPGTVGLAAFSYGQVVIGYLLGYFVIAYVLLPLYYRLNLTSIYNYLEHRFGIISYKTGALFFIISRTLGATARLYLVINVLQIFILKDLGISFGLTTFIILIMILLYTFEGGVKTIVYTDTLQTTFMLLGLVVCMIYIMSNMNHSIGSTLHELSKTNLTKIFNTDTNSSGFFLKSILGGMFITIGMTGLDQEMMQKNISVKTLKDSQKNMITFSVIMVVVNFLFLLLGGVLFLYGKANNVVVPGDDLFPTIALKGFMPAAISIIFIIALISALFPSADGALTALTSSFCLDILGLKRRDELSEKQNKRTRLTVHITFAAIFFLIVMGFKLMDSKSIIDIILKVAGFTYGPLLGLFAFGILTKRKVNDRLSLYICLLAPLLILGIDFVNNIEWWQKQVNVEGAWVDGVKTLSHTIFGNFKIGTELLIYNGILTFLGLYLISKPQPVPVEVKTILEHGAY
ncbi:sodium:solute symporter [Flavisolibacter ginsengisoli]|jgi:SSS family transporter|uniref:Transporter, SSS family n=1 Tax=Flavisolibacter ginsengisoli DSM 18119 TaxID=1121884 RepID=A0A1M5EYF7_9BACT|nr:sodium:solute symporter [Flavisolibacter ginsengisoli]SHF84072.1 transporter, SSS family [Flavisolibacter ginsengisoli DSM 18119]